ncbi:MAG: helix-turn-helix domain-containing protein [Coriobacteriaceae bacterium]
MYKERDPELIKFGANLRAIRVGHGYSQQYVADVCGISRTYLSKVENGAQSATVQLCFRLAEVYELHISQLFEGIE